MKQVFIIASFFLIIGAATAQDDFFDTPTMVALIEHNKQNYGDHQELRDKQVVSQATVSA